MSACSITTAHDYGWEGVALDNGLIRLFVVPQLGGRIMQLALAGRELFYINRNYAGRIVSSPAGWINYGGSKVWPAPQGWSSDAEWPGPPDPVLDAGAYSCETIEIRAETAAIRLRSQADDYTGVVFERDIRINSDSTFVMIDHRMRNASPRPVRWSIWQVTQQDASSPLTIVAPIGEWRQMFGDAPAQGVSSTNGLLRVSYSPPVAKLAIKPSSGWIAGVHHGSNVLFCETFKLLPLETYPDNAPLQVWVNAPGQLTLHGERIDLADEPNGCDPYVESEILSPLVTLDPGGSYAFRIRWSCAAVDDNLAGPPNFCGAAVEPLRLTLESNTWRVRGQFAVFHRGRLELVMVAADGRVVTVESLGEVSPNSALTLDHRFPTSPAFARASLRLREPTGELLGTLAETVSTPSGQSNCELL
jgi:hypothetical protein